MLTQSKHCVNVSYYYGLSSWFASSHKYIYTVKELYPSNHFYLLSTGNKKPQINCWHLLIFHSHIQGITKSYQQHFFFRKLLNMSTSLYCHQNHPCPSCYHISPRYLDWHVNLSPRIHSLCCHINSLHWSQSYLFRMKIISDLHGHLLLFHNGFLLSQG